MRLSRGIAPRVLVVAAVSGVFGAATAVIVASTVARESIVSQLAPLVVSRFRSADALACQAAPDSWTWTFPAVELRGYAYDGTTGTSRNVNAPPLRRDLLTTLGREPSAFLVELDGPTKGGGIVFRTAAPAPCDVVQTRWQRPIVQGRFVMTFVASGIAAALLASALGLCALVLPLTTRIRKLRAAASRVGELDGYEALGGREDGDELDSLAAILDRAHARIRNDALLLLEQRDALERHLANVAHDLRTPLTSLQVALEHASDSTNEPAVRETLAGALSDAVYLAALTSNLRLASQLRTGWNPAAQPCLTDLGELLTRIAARAELLARRRSIELAVAVPDEPVRVSCNAVAAEQAFSNVIDNAAAHGDAHGHVAVVLSRRDDGASFAVEVRDDGPGVPPRELPRLGERTFRSDDARQRDPHGNGLGLAITAEVCARFGWSLRFAALEPRGLLVTIAGDIHDESSK